MFLIAGSFDGLTGVGDIPTGVPDRGGTVTVSGRGDEPFGSARGDRILDDRILDERIVASEGDDEVRRLGGDNLLAGGPGDDTLVTADGDDELSGGPAADALRGGGGDDLVLGEAGDDRVTGGGDTFAWRDAAEGPDTLADFEPGVDRLRLDGELRGFAGEEAGLGAFVRFGAVIGRCGGIEPHRRRPMSRACSTDLRGRALGAYEAGEGSQTRVAERCRIGERTRSTWLKTARVEARRVRPPARRARRRPAQPLGPVPGSWRRSVCSGRKGAPGRRAGARGRRPGAGRVARRAGWGRSGPGRSAGSSTGSGSATATCRPWTAPLSSARPQPDRAGLVEAEGAAARRGRPPCRARPALAAITGQDARAWFRLCGYATAD